MINNEIILKDDSRAATYRTDIKGWVSRDGFFFGDNKDSEYAARNKGATHNKCSCGSVYPIRGVYYTLCPDCRNKAKRARYEKLELVEWDEQTPLCLYDDDKYFYCVDEVIEYCEELDIEPASLMLVLCKKADPPTIDIDNYAPDHLAEEQETPIEAYGLCDEFNKALAEIWPESWVGGNKRVSLKG